MAKRNKILFSAIGFISILALLSFYFGFIESRRTLSTDRHFSVSYNVLTNTITTFDQHSGETTRLIIGYDPDFLWAPDSKRLAITATNEYGKRWSNVIDLEKHMGIVMPSKSRILYAVNGIEETDDENNATVIIDEWLDNTHVLMKFSLIDDTETEVTGWFTFDLITREIEDLQILQ